MVTSLAARGTDSGAWSTLSVGPLLVVSPHLDDAALSCAALLERDEPVDVLTVFAGIPADSRQGVWDAVCGFTTGAEAMRARREEDASAFRGSPHRITHLDLLEGQHVAWRRTSPERVVVQRALQGWLEGRRTGAVAIPAGAGVRRTLPRRARNKAVRALERRRAARGSRLLALVSGSPEGLEQHLDHTFVRDAVLAALDERAGFTPLLYEEVPYLSSAPADSEVERVAASWQRLPTLVVLPVDRVRKAQRIRAYESQVPHVRPASDARLDEPGALSAVERYWRLDATR